MASADVYTSHGGGWVGEAYTCDTPVSVFRDVCAVCVWMEQAVQAVYQNAAARLVTLTSRRTQSYNTHS